MFNQDYYRSEGFHPVHIGGERICKNLIINSVVAHQLFLRPSPVMLLLGLSAICNPYFVSYPWSVPHHQHGHSFISKLNSECCFYLLLHSTRSPQSVSALSETEWVSEWQWVGWDDALSPFSDSLPRSDNVWLKITLLGPFFSSSSSPHSSSSWVPVNAILLLLLCCRIN